MIAKKILSLMLCALLLSASALAETESAAGDCAHENSYIEGQLAEASHSPVDEYTHRTVGILTEILHCEDCGAEITGEPTEYDEQEFHNFFGEGVCSDCGYACTHESTDVYEETRNITRKPLDDKSHTVSGQLYELTVCMNCGHLFEEKLADPEYSFEETHMFYEGVCEDCGMKNPCTHENTETLEATEYIDCQPLNEQEHVYSCILYGDTECVDCGEFISSAVINDNYQETEFHEFYEGQCGYCGMENTCEHANTETTKDFAPYEFAQKDPIHHTAVGEQYEHIRCLDCGEELAYNLIAEDHEALSPHWFWEGVCMECGYVDDLDESIRLIETVGYYMDMLDDLMNELGAAVSLLNADQILTVEEQIAFNDLLLADQSMVLMSAIGYDAAIESAIGFGIVALPGEEAGHEIVVLSEEAAALRTAVTDRLAAMDAADQAAYAQKLDESFPVIRTLEDGTLMRTFLLDLTTDEEGEMITERYQLLYNEDFGEWLFDAPLTEAEAE